LVVGFWFCGSSLLLTPVVVGCYGCWLIVIPPPLLIVDSTAVAVLLLFYGSFWFLLLIVIVPVGSLVGTVVDCLVVIYSGSTVVVVDPVNPRPQPDIPTTVVVSLYGALLFITIVTVRLPCCCSPSVGPILDVLRFVGWACRLRLVHVDPTVIWYLLP
jgi:hypothetical protein